MAGTSCYIVLLMALMDTWKERKISPYPWVIFVSGFVGALINTVAPGNYARYETTGGEGKLHVFRAISGVFAGKYISYKKVIYFYSAERC